MLSLPLLTAWIFQPSTLNRVGAGAMVVTIVGAAYCAGLSALFNGAPVWSLVGFWTIATVLPWYFAYEANKYVLRLRASRAIKAFAVLLIMSATLAACGAADWILAQTYGYQRGVSPPIHILQHLPETALIAFLTLMSSMLAARQKPEADKEHVAPLPVAPKDIRLVRGAGNYVELYLRSRTILHRATLNEVERALIPHDFVRVSRSTIIPRAEVREFYIRRGQSSVRLFDGSEHPVGTTYAPHLRSNLD